MTITYWTQTAWMLGLLLGAAILIAPGCASPTYINIPAEAGDLAFHNPNAKDVQQMQVVAIKRSLQWEPIGGNYLLELPKGTSAQTFERINAELDGAAVSPQEVQGQSLPAIHVKAIRIRGGRRAG